MRSLDTNLLLFSISEDAPEHEAAASFVEAEEQRSDVVVSEWALVELYNLLRNPAVFAKPLAARAAVDVIQNYRQHPRWGLVSFPSSGVAVHDALWSHASSASFARRRVFDARMALCLRGCGVTDFATSNVQDFSNFGFHRVWNPLEPTA